MSTSTLKIIALALCLATGVACGSTRANVADTPPATPEIDFASDEDTEAVHESDPYAPFLDRLASPFYDKLSAKGVAVLNDGSNPNMALSASADLAYDRATDRNRIALTGGFLSMTLLDLVRTGDSVDALVPMYATNYKGKLDDFTLTIPGFDSVRDALAILNFAFVTDVNAIKSKSLETNASGSILTLEYESHVDRFLFSASKSDLLRYEREAGRARTTVTYGGYSVVDGARVPKEITARNLPTGSEVRLSLTSVRVNKGAVFTASSFAHVSPDSGVRR